MEPALPKYQMNGFTSESYPFTSGDGFNCNLVRVRGKVEPSKGPVLLVHGAGVSASIFLAPVKQNIVQYLVEEGYDVWLENWRASIDFAPNMWNLDMAAVFDHPYAVKKVVAETGSPKIKAIIHCQGSTSFTMSAIAGLVPEVDTIVSNAVSLHPVVPQFSRFKLSFMLPLMKNMTDYLNPHWGIYAPTMAAKLVKALVNLTHHECNNSVCKQVSFTYGSGFPALWRHENLNDETHEWIKEEFAEVPMTFYNQISRSVQQGHLVPMGDNSLLPRSFVAQKPATDARFSFFAGARNLCFLACSQARSFEYFDKLRKNYHTLKVLPEYSHLDVFLGKNSYKDVFPIMSQELSKQ